MEERAGVRGEDGRRGDGQPARIMAGKGEAVRS
jgi:hypothetical protein